MPRPIPDDAPTTSTRRPASRPPDALALDPLALDLAVKRYTVPPHDRSRHDDHRQRRPRARAPRLLGDVHGAGLSRPGPATGPHHRGRRPPRLRRVRHRARPARARRSAPSTARPWGATAGRRSRATSSARPAAGTRRRARRTWTSTASTSPCSTPPTCCTGSRTPSSSPRCAARTTTGCTTTAPRIPSDSWVSRWCRCRTRSSRSASCSGA